MPGPFLTSKKHVFHRTPPMSGLRLLFLALASYLANHQSEKKRQFFFLFFVTMIYGKKDLQKGIGS